MASNAFLYLCICTSNILALVLGTVLSWSSPVMPKLEKDNDDNPLGGKIDETDAAWVVSMLSLGAAVGPFVAAFLTGKVGRKWTLVTIGVTFAAAFLLMAFAANVYLLMVARAIAGLGIGSCFTVLPSYIAELSSDDVRGMMGASMNVFLVTGLLTSYSLGPYVSIMVFSLVCAIFSVIFVVIFTLFAPESPVYLVSKGKDDMALKVIKRLRGHDDIKAEHDAMLKSHEDNSGGNLSQVVSIRSNRKALTISSGLVILQQVSGINIVLFNAQAIFDAAGTSIPAEISPIIIGAVQVAASFVTPVAVDRLGRKILLLISAVGMLVAETPLGVYFYLKDDNQDVDAIFWLPIVCLIVYIITYNFGFGPLPWTVMAELFPPNIKNFACCITASICWLVSFFLTHFYPSLSDSIGIGPTFWIFSSCNALAILFVVFFVPETKGKSASEIQDILNS